MLIVSDSSCDIWSLHDTNFQTVPLDINTDERQFTDDKTLDVHEMLDYLSKYKGRSYTACPSVDRWLEAFGQEQEIYVVVLTSKISGAYNSAECARELYLEKHPNAKVKVFDILTTAAEQVLIIEKIKELKDNGLEFEEVVDQITEYVKTTHLFFAFESLHNFAQNGRVSKILAQTIGVLGISIIGAASEVGDIKPLGKCRGKKNVIENLFSQMKEEGYKGGKVKISHIENEQLAEKFADKIRESYPDADIQIYPSRGLVAYYGERGGILIGCEC